MATVTATFTEEHYNTEWQDLTEEQQSEFTTLTMNKAWQADLVQAKYILRLPEAEVSSIDIEWLLDVIDMSNHEERKELREGLEVGPRSLWFDYNEQCWID